MTPIFPGIDPYLEDPDLWPDVHFVLIAQLRAALNTCLPTGYVARADRHIYIHEPPALERLLLLGRPDVPVLGPEAVSAGPATLIDAPCAVALPVVPRTGTRFVKVVNTTGHRLVAAIELLSHSNKLSGPDRDAYLTKRGEYLAAGVNLVEIDFLRGGQRMPMGEPPTADYYVLVCRASQLPRAGVWPLSVREPLPTVPVPLDEGVADVPLDLAACWRAVVDSGRYEIEVNYKEPPRPRFHGPGYEWVRERLQEKGIV